MIRAIATAVFCLFTAPVLAQEASSANGAMIRVLDKTTGSTVDLEMSVGETKHEGRLEIYLGDCRYPAGNPSGDAFALLAILPRGQDELAFRGWMVASSPALNAMDHPRYDVWVLRCTTS
ncbi:DUF2155 domain-containing protein [Aestuariibius sp. HNIBRBA575]|uniref:DUF2155 domain-containing protein n=1 Tax=Aestuariibius sp. HNIBRBA575 TaxID=3233343 RepID=UPI0034A43852